MPEKTVVFLIKQKQEVNLDSISKMLHSAVEGTYPKDYTITKRDAEAALHFIQEYSV